MGTSGSPAALVLTELVLFWAATLLHMHRLLSFDQLPDADRLEDAGHMAMGAGMTVMVFPGVPVGILHISAAGFAVLAVAFLGRALYPRGSTRHRLQNAVISTGQGATAYMLAVPAHPPALLSTTVSAALALCVLVHGWRLVESRRNTHAPETARMLAIFPHAGTLAMTAAMAWMAATA